jgi:hypothetical protein
MFASGGDSVNVGRLGSTVHADRWDESVPARPSGDEATAWMARRLQGRLDRQQWLLDQHLHSEPSAVPELLELARRMRRDTEILQLLSGDESGLRAVAARRLADAVTDAVSAAEEPSRVAVRSAPGASITPAASTEFGHVVSAAIDHVTTAYPDARVDLASRVENLGGITVDIGVDGAIRNDSDGPDGRATHNLADLLAARSRQGVELRRPAGGPPTSGSGLVISVHCPPAAVTVDEPVWPSISSTGDRFRGRVNGTGTTPPVRGNGFNPAYNTGSHPIGRNGFDHQGGYPGERSGGFYGTDPTPGEATGPGRAAAYSDGYGSGGYRGGFDPLNDPLPPTSTGGFPSPTSNTGSYPAAGTSAGPAGGWTDNGYPAGHTDTSGYGGGYGDTGGYPAGGYGGTGSFNRAGNGAGTGNGNGYPGNGAAGNGHGYGGNGANGYADNRYDTDPPFGSTSLTGPSLPAYQPSRASGVDELFGPLLDLPIEPMDDRFATPIFEAIASVWFRDEQEPDGQRGLEWETPNDAEWRAASERAVSEPVAESLTATGLPRRRPGGQLVPPPLSRRPAPVSGPAERVPDRVRDRLSTYQRGLRQGRHRAPGETSEYGEW